MPEDTKPRWMDEPPPGFMPDGTSMIVPVGQKIKWPEQKIIDKDGKEYSLEEWDEKEKDEQEAGEEADEEDNEDEEGDDDSEDDDEE